MIDLRIGNSKTELKNIASNSVDSIVTDPPYELGFMGKSWDSTGIAYDVELWKECLRVLKPGGHLLAFSGTRTYHRMAVAIEDAGFEVRDMIEWVYGCLSEDTEILTINGWEHYHKNIDKSLVLCYDINTANFSFELPTKKFLYENKHTAYRIKSNFTDQVVSKYHRCLVEREGRLVFKRAETLQRQENIPFWKTCHICQKQFTTHTKAQALRNKTCSQECRNVILKSRPQKPITHLIETTCQVCGKTFQTRKNRSSKYCSQSCNGQVRGQEWKNHAHKGRANWKPESEQALKERMTGDKNWAWKGGVTYFKRKGKYADQKIKYVRCPKEFQEMARKDGYVMEHRLNVAKILNRPLTRAESAHHINHNATDNRLENLMLFKTNSDHKRYEHGQDIKPLWQP